MIHKNSFSSSLKMSFQTKYLFSLCIFVCVLQCYANSVSNADKSERIVGDKRQGGNCRNGEPIEYWFNETESSANNYLPSSPGCPKSLNSSRWVYFEDQSDCWLTGYRGPCSWGHVVVAQDDSFYGTCACKCATTPKAKASKRRYVSCKSENGDPVQIWDKKRSRCYFVGERGPCKNSEVLKKSRNGSPTCIAKCNKKNPNYKSLKASGRCGLRNKDAECDESTNYAGFEDVEQVSCPPGKTYSERTQSCVRIVKQLQ